MYDNESTKLQAIYNLPWSFDSTHLHTVMLQPIFKPSAPTKSTPQSNPNSRAAWANSRPCGIAKSLGKACGLSHLGVSHKTTDPTSTQLLPLNNSPLNRDLWLSELLGDEDSAFLSNGICNGFQLVSIGTTFGEVEQENYKSATKSCQQMHSGRNHP